MRTILKKSLCLLILLSMLLSMMPVGVMATSTDGSAGGEDSRSFTFRGTGFDIISRTGKEQATIRLEVMNNATKEVVKRLTVNNKGELELYQIPVVSVQGLAYGEYTVTLWVNKAVDSNYDFLKCGGQFHFDAVRIYEPIETEKDSLNEEEGLALDAYLADKEAYSYIKEIRNVLLNANDFYALTDETDGAVFVDVNSSMVDPDPEASETQEPETSEGTEVTLPPLETEGYHALTINTYNKIGPKNEVYLSPDQAVAFMLKIDSKQTPVSIDIGAKTIQGDTVTLAAGFVAGLNSDEPINLTKVLTEIRSSTAQYFALDEAALPQGEDVYLILYNATEKTEGQKDTEGVLSITDLKIAYDTKPNEALPEDKPTDPEVKGMAAHSTAPVRFAIDNRVGEAIRTFLRALHETPVDEETDMPAVQGDMRIYHNLNLASDISVNYLVPMADLEGFDLSTVYMESLLDVYEGSTRVGTTTLRLTPVEKNGYYYFALTGLTAVQMNDRISTTLYGVKEGQIYYSATDEYSIASYAYSQLNKAAVADSLKTVCADLLRYGAKAQIFKSYRLDQLADANMTETHKTYLSDIEAVTFGNTNVMLKDLKDPTITWAGKTLDLGSKVTLKFICSIANYNGNLGDLNLRVSYTNIEGETVTTTVEDVEDYNLSNQQYAFSFDGLLAAELRSVVSVQVYEKDTPVSCTLQYSADTYGNNKTGTLGTLCKALFAYSDSANAYFQ